MSEATETFSGQVVSLSSDTITSKSSGRTFRVHKIQLDSGVEINVGFKQPFSVGDKVSIPSEIKYGEWKMVAKGVALGLPSSSGTTAPAPRKEYGSGKNTKFPVPKDHGDYSIIRQNALTNAVNLYNGSEDKKTGITDEDIEFVIKVAYKFAEFSSGHREERIQRELRAGSPVKGD